MGEGPPAWEGVSLKPQYRDAVADLVGFGQHHAQGLDALAKGGDQAGEGAVWPSGIAPTPMA